MAYFSGNFSSSNSILKKLTLSDGIENVILSSIPNQPAFTLSLNDGLNNQIQFNQTPNTPISISGVVFSTGGNLTINTNYSWIIVYVTDSNIESHISPNFTSNSGATGTLATLTIPISSQNFITSRKIYRQMLNLSGIADFYLVGAISNNINTTFIDDGSITFNSNLMTPKSEYINPDSKDILTGALSVGGLNQPTAILDIRDNIQIRRTLGSGIVSTNCYLLIGQNQSDKGTGSIISSYGFRLNSNGLNDATLLISSYSAPNLASEANFNDDSNYYHDLLSLDLNNGFQILTKSIFTQQVNIGTNLLGVTQINYGDFVLNGTQTIINSTGSQNAFILSSGDNTELIGYQIGRASSEFQMGVASGNSDWFTDVVEGDIVFQGISETSRLLLGIHDLSAIIISSNGVEISNNNIFSISAVTNQIVLGTGNTTTLNVPAPTGNIIINFPISNSTLSTLNLTETITGQKTFSSEVFITPVTNQLKLGSSTILNASGSVNNITVNFPQYSSILSGINLNENISGTKLFENNTLFGSKILDQDTSGYSISSTIGGAGSFWQTFTPAITGYLNSISINMESSPNGAPATMTVYSGIGTTGSVLGSATVFLTSSFSFITANFSPETVFLVLGNSYTFSISNVSQAYNYSTTVYPGGYAGLITAPISPSCTFLFTTYITETLLKFSPSSALTVYETISIAGNEFLPTGGGAQLFMASGFPSPCTGKIYCGDGTGWNLYISSRNSSVDTDIFQFSDQGNFYVNSSSNQLILGTTNKITLNAPTPTSNISLTLPSESNDTLVARGTTDTFNGLKSFTNIVKFLSPLIDQNTSGYSSSGSLNGSVLWWQSFTPSTSGYLYSIYIKSQSLTGDPINTTMSIYLGTGLSGSNIGTTNFTISNTDNNNYAYFINNPIYLTANTQYTFNITTGQNIFIQYSNTVYSGGHAGNGSISNSYTFLFADYLSTQLDFSYNPSTTITSISNLQFNNSISSYIPTSLNYYEILDLVIAFTNAIPSTNANIRIIRTGNVVSFGNQTNLSVSAISANPINGSSLIPTRFCPTGQSSLILPIMVRNNSNITIGCIQIDLTGQITIFNGNLGNFSNGTLVGFPCFNISWVI